MTLTATRRPVSSSPRNTTPMPPSPRRPSSRTPPTRRGSPGCRTGAGPPVSRVASPCPPSSVIDGILRPSIHGYGQRTLLVQVPAERVRARRRGGDQEAGEPASGRGVRRGVDLGAAAAVGGADRG